MAETGITGSSAQQLGGGGDSISDLEARAAVLTAAALYVVGGSLTATALVLPHVSSPAGIVFVAASAALTAAVLVLAVSRGHAGSGLAWLAEMWGVVEVTILCASSGGARSPFALIYLFAIGHAAAFQPRSRFVIVSSAGLVAFLAPFVYGHVSGTFVATACIGIVMALLTTGIIHYALNRMRDQRREQEFLIAATAKLDSSLEPAETLRIIARTAVPELAELCVVDLLDRSGLIGTTVAAAVDPNVAARVERIRETSPVDMHGKHPVAQVLRTSEPRVIEDLSDRAALEDAAQSSTHWQFALDAGYRSAAVFPMVARGRTRGAISFLRIQRAARYGPGQLAVLEDLVGRAALAFDNARLYAERAQVARTLRRSLMPAVLPVIPGLELASYFRPMGASNEVGGDFYDAFGDDQSCWLVVGDVCGKGAEAAALTGFLRHTIAAYTREDSSPAKVLSEVNRATLDQDFDGRFATVILAHLEFVDSEARLTVAAAGHPPALIARSGGSVTELGSAGTLLGVFSDPIIDEVSTVLTDGDSLALYTDGLPEAHAPERAVTVAQMIVELGQAPPRFAQDTIDALLGLVDLNDEVRDDIAILAARVTSTA